MISREGLPDTPEWSCDPRPDPFVKPSTTFEAAEIPANVILGCE